MPHQGDGVAAAEHAGQHSMAVVKDAEAGVTATPVPARLPALCLGQDLTARFEWGTSWSNSSRVMPVRVGSVSRKDALAGISRTDLVVRLAVELIAGDALHDGLAFGPDEFAAGGVVVLVQRGLDGRSSAGVGGRDGLYQHLVARQGPAAEAVGDAGEQPVSDFLVACATHLGSGTCMANCL